jgi:hypothetical protein
LAKKKLPKEKPQAIDLTHSTTKHHRDKRSAETGRYVIVFHEYPAPKKLRGVEKVATRTGSGGGKPRRADTGRYTTKEYAKEHPKTTVTEHDKPKPKKKK